MPMENDISMVTVFEGSYLDAILRKNALELAGIPALLWDRYNDEGEEPKVVVAAKDFEIAKSVLAKHTLAEDSENAC